jgi:type IV secretion system protein VirD4
MAYPDLREAYKNLTPRRKLAVCAVVVLLAYVLDAWLLGSMSLIFSDWALMMRCFSDPFLAAIEVPMHASLFAWFFMNLFVGAFLAVFMYCVLTRYPELFQRLFRKSEPNISDDPTCGTSNWMTKDEAKEFFNFGYGPSILLGSFEGELVRHNDSPRFNKNVIAFGSPGTGKTWSLIFPNLLQAIDSGESIIVTDPKMDALRAFVPLLQKKGYVVRVLNLKEMLTSDRINPIAEVKDDMDALLLAGIIMNNTEGAKGRPKGDEFWERAEKNLLIALIHYVASDEMAPENRTIAGLYTFLTDGSFDDLDNTFMSLPESHPAKKPYNLFCKSNPKTRGDILGGLGSRFKIFQNETVKQLTSTNDFDMELPGRQKCAYICVIPDNDQTFIFLSAMFFSFLFLRLSQQADRFGGMSAVPVNFIMDEFCTIGAIQDFTDRIATMRSRNINCLMAAQSLPQLGERYPFNTWKEIIGCCALRMVWGASDLDTQKYFSDMLGKSTVEQVSYRRPVGGFEGAHMSKGPRERALMDLSEVGRIPKDDAIALVQGGKPIRFKKVPCTQHPLYNELTPLKKYIPVRNREIVAPDIKFDDSEYLVEEASGSWRDVVAR